jgi:hypothetical protein
MHDVASARPAKLRAELGRRRAALSDEIKSERLRTAPSSPPGALAMGELALGAQHAIERRFRRDTLAAVGELWHDLLGRAVDELGRVRDAQDAGTLTGRQGVGRNMARSAPAVLAAADLSPAPDRILPNDGIAAFLNVQGYARV